MNILADYEAFKRENNQKTKVVGLILHNIFGSCSNSLRDPKWLIRAWLTSSPPQPANSLINRQGLRGDWKTGRTSYTGDSYWHTVCVCVSVSVCVRAFVCVWMSIHACECELAQLVLLPKRGTCLAVVISTGRVLLAAENIFTKLSFSQPVNQACPLWGERILLAGLQLQWRRMFTVNGTLWVSE